MHSCASQSSTILVHVPEKKDVTPFHTVLAVVEIPFHTRGIPYIRTDSSFQKVCCGLICHMRNPGKRESLKSVSAVTDGILSTFPHQI
jgi:hypothetical protein